MGIFDILKPKSALEKAAKDVKEVYSQPEYRREAMDKLFEMGTREAYVALLGRFSINASGQIADEQEKRELVDRLVEIGHTVVSPLEDYIRSEQTIAFPIRALVRILDKPDAIRFLIETLRRYEPLDHRSTKAKITLITTLADLCTPADTAVFVPYLEDHDDDVQWNAIVAVEKLGDETAREALAKVCCGDAHAQRIQRRAAQALLERQWPVKEAYEQFNAELRSEYLLGKKGVLVPKAASKE